MTSEAARRGVNEGRVFEFEHVIGYQAIVQARNIIVHRTGLNPVGVGAPKKPAGRWHSVWDLSSNSNLPNNDVEGFKDSQDREKKELQVLNERLANYIESNRFLKVQNAKLERDLEKLKAKWSIETPQIKALYQAELDEARRLLEEAVREKGRMEVRLASVEEIMVELRRRLAFALKDAEDAKEKFEKQNQQLSDLEGEVGLLRRRLESLETERDNEIASNQRLQEALDLARKDLNSETLLHIYAESKQQSLEEELKFLKTIHEQDMKELSALISSDSTCTNREFWKNEMGKALRDIQEAYDQRMDEIQSEQESYYNSKLEIGRVNVDKYNIQLDHFQKDNERLRNELEILHKKLGDPDSKYAKLQLKFDLLRREKEESERDLEQRNDDLMKQVARHKAEIEAMLKEIRIILDTKHGLELEIITYRRLLELDENQSGFHQIFQFGDEDNIIVGPPHPGPNPGGDRRHIIAEPIGGPINPTQDFEIVPLRDESKRAGGVKRETREFEKWQFAGLTIAITDCCMHGQFVVLQNTGKKEMDLQNWSLIREIKDKPQSEFKFCQPTVLRPEQKIKVWSNSAKPTPLPPDDVVSKGDWGVGRHIVTKLFNEQNEEYAKYIEEVIT